MFVPRLFLYWVAAQLGYLLRPVLVDCAGRMSVVVITVAILIGMSASSAKVIRESARGNSRGRSLNTNRGDSGVARMPGNITSTATSKLCLD